MLSISRSTADCNCTMFQPRRSLSGAKYLSFLPEEDLRGRNVVQLQSTVLCEMLNITTATGVILYMYSNNIL